MNRALACDCPSCRRSLKILRAVRLALRDTPKPRRRLAGYLKAQTIPQFGRWYPNAFWGEGGIGCKPQIDGTVQDVDGGGSWGMVVRSMEEER